MKELFSVNLSGHRMSEPRTLDDLAEVLHHERRETHAHWNGATSQNGTAVNLITASVAFVDSVPHAPVEYSASDLTRQYQTAAVRYHEGMAQALDALKVMQNVAEAATRQHEVATAMAKQRGRRTSVPRQ